MEIRICEHSHFRIVTIGIRNIFRQNVFLTEEDRIENSTTLVGISGHVNITLNDVAEASRNNSVVVVDVLKFEKSKLNASRVVYAVKTSLLGVSNREKPSVQIESSAFGGRNRKT